MSSKETQSDKFKRLAREAEADESESAFGEKLKRLAKAKPEKDKPDGRTPKS